MLSRLAIMPLPVVVGGPRIFAEKLARELVHCGIECVASPRGANAVLVINATRRAAELIRAKRAGVRIVQRLGNPFYLHRLGPRVSRPFMLNEFRNAMMGGIRRFVADWVIYQSQFAEEWWKRTCGRGPAGRVVYNGVDLSHFAPYGDRYTSPAEICVLSVEGRHAGGLREVGIPLAEALLRRGRSVELVVLGSMSAEEHDICRRYSFVSCQGVANNEALPPFYRGATFFVSTDVIAACPNAVIEALACGTPVLGYDASVLPELLDDSAGRLVRPQGDVWKGQPAGNIELLADAAVELVANRPRLSQNARQLAEQRFDVKDMVAHYREVLGLSS